MTSILNFDEGMDEALDGTRSGAEAVKTGLEEMNSVMADDQASTLGLQALVRILLGLRQKERDRQPRETLQEMSKAAERAIAKAAGLEPLE